MAAPRCQHEEQPAETSLCGNPLRRKLIDLLLQFNHLLQQRLKIVVREQPQAR